MHKAHEARALWNGAVTRGPDECWLWIGQRNAAGYGRLALPGFPVRVVAAHRFAWEVANGAAVPSGMFVLHSCDTPSCVNPAHLRAGTHAENMRDRAERGRTRCKKHGKIGQGG